MTRINKKMDIYDHKTSIDLCKRDKDEFILWLSGFEYFTFIQDCLKHQGRPGAWILNNKQLCIGDIMCNMNIYAIIFLCCKKK